MRAIKTTAADSQACVAHGRRPVAGGNRSRACAGDTRHAPRQLRSGALIALLHLYELCQLASLLDSSLMETVIKIATRLP